MEAPNLSTPISQLKGESHGMTKEDVVILQYVFGNPRDPPKSIWVKGIKQTLLASVLFLVFASDPVDKMLSQSIKSSFIRLIVKLLMFLLLFVIIDRFFLR